ncbi:hypothetical protein Tmar_1826 [Thermaerobacter marianensis DSM 12885]|uniref:Uncharacterized protein n=1 Tax=Thermaerobacter marianensis (strain ATCC 700841 / DSM 12885 / JCM 10246 / 7p75a) TaxID=644966 RepID=E6SIB6_THEM7|nr:hypothetical protein [Thermaerobacter marianensis]ADU51927.1 hypothetical protein Tmar_1826 [Thermaerobacter marianensis DSM 12885]
MRRVTVTLAYLVGTVGSTGVLYGALFWLPYHLQGSRFHATGIILLGSLLALLLLSWAPLVVRRSKRGASAAKLLGYDLAFAAGTAILAVPFLLSPVRLIFLLPLVAYLVLVGADLVGCLRRPPAW